MNRCLGKLVIENVSHGTLEERIRAAGMEITESYLRTGVSGQSLS